MTDTNTSPIPDPQDEPIDAQFEPAPEPEAASARKSGPGWASLGIACTLSALVGAGAGIFGQEMLRPAAPAIPPQLEAALADLSARQEALEERLAAEPETPPELAGLIRELDEASRRLDEALAGGDAVADVRALQARIEEIEASSGQSRADAGNSELEMRISGLEAALAERAEQPADPDAQKRAETAQAFAAIETAARRGAAFDADYRILRAAAPEAESVRRLAPFVSGVETLASLQASFPGMRSEALAAHEAARAGEGSQLSWLNRVLGDAVTVRPAGGSDDPVSAAFDSAAQSLARGDLPGAAETLAALEGAAARAAQGWTREANRRITLEAALDEVRQSLTGPEN